MAQREHPFPPLGLAILAWLGALVGACAAPPPPPVAGNLAAWLDGRGAEVGTAGKGAGRASPTPAAAPATALPAQASRAFRRRLEERLAAPAGADTPAVARLRRALAHIEADRLDHAAVELKDLLEEQPDHFVALALLANVRLRQDDPGQGLELVGRALARAPADLESRLLQAWAHALRGEEGDLERAVRLYREIPSAAFPGGRRDHLLARALLALDRVEEALALVEKALAAHGESVALLQDKVTALLRLGRCQAAAETCRRLVEPPHGPDLEKLWLYARVLRRAGDFAGASRTLDAILEKGGPDLEAFCTNHLPRPALEKVARLAREEKRAGRRLGFLPGEELAICLTPGKPEEKEAALVRLLRQGTPRAYRAALLACLADPLPDVRQSGIKALARRGLAEEEDRELLSRALEDEDYRVRSLAALALAARGGEKSREVLLRALEQEEKGYVFACICRALEKVTGKQVFLLGGEADRPEARERIRREWQEKLAP